MYLLVNERTVVGNGGGTTRTLLRIFLREALLSF